MAGHTRIHGGDIPPAVGQGRQEATNAALKVIWVSASILAIAAVLEIIIGITAHSAGVLADGFHNGGDVASAFALAVAFRMSRRPPSTEYPYGWHRSEDIATLVVLLLIVGSAVASGVTSVSKLVHPVAIHDVALAAITALIGFGANELAGIYKIRAGRKLGSMALTADGKHSRLDGVASVGAAIGVLGTLVHLPLLDPIAGLVITGLIVFVAWETLAQIGGRLFDQADADMIHAIRDVAGEIHEVHDISDVRARWIGRRLYAELSIEVDGNMTVQEAHAIGEDVRYHLHYAIEPLADIVLHFDPAHDPHAHEVPSHHQGGAYPHEDSHLHVDESLTHGHHHGQGNTHVHTDH
ncbi:MAG: cation diffusion facilitator family transporter [Candidatus Dormibacteria bacterium]